MDPIPDLKLFQDRVTSSLLDVTRKAGQISAEDLSFHRSSNNSLCRNLDAQNARLLRLTQRLLEAATATEPNVELPKLQNGEDLDDHWSGLVDVIDDLLEQADACLDEYTGVIKKMSPAAQDESLASINGIENRFKTFPFKSQSRQLAKPQLLFNRPPANHEVIPFKPLLRTKPHAVVELEQSIGKAGTDGYKHPYAAEIERYSYPGAVHAAADPVPYRAPTETQAIFVNTQEGVNDMLAELRNASEIAVDLEHHDSHSYLGIVCLMQISTRQKDWIIDTLVPWREDLQVLNEVFANPNILKVLQGSSKDIIWLQRDLGLYIVGLFDTFHGSTALGFPQKSLKYLLRRFCDFDADKQHQLADWRIRPIPQEMLDYARSDTHYLLYIYDNLRNMLLEASTPDNRLINYVLERSKREALQRYDRPVYDAEKGLGPIGWFNLLARRWVRFTPEQFAVYRAVHEWRDQTARRLDEGTAFIMNQVTLFALAEAMPTTVHALLRATNRVSPAIKAFSHDLAEIISNAKRNGREGPTVADVMRENSAFTPCQGSHQGPMKSLQHQGMAATLQRLNENGDVDSHVDRAFGSQLWGTVSKPSVATSQSLAPAHDALSLVLPLPAIKAMSFVPHAETNHAEQVVEPCMEAESPKEASQEAKARNYFTLHELGQSLGTSVGVAGLNQKQNPGQGTSGTNDTVGSSREKHAQKSMAHRADVQEQREAKQAMQDLGSSSDRANGISQTEPFDYAKAESVLRVKQGQSRSSEPGAGQRRFNPAAKALDAPRGMKRTRQEAGRSFTFKK